MPYSLLNVRVLVVNGLATILQSFFSQSQYCVNQAYVECVSAGLTKYKIIAERIATACTDSLLKQTMPWQVYQALRSDFSSRRKDRCIRVDFSGGVVSGMDDLERMLRDAIKSTFEARAGAYDEQVRLSPIACYSLSSEAGSQAGCSKAG